MLNKPIQKSIEVDGFVLHYTIEGSGPAAIVIGSSLYYPKTFSQNLRTHLRMIFMDHRGFGKATKDFDSKAFELDRLLEDVETLRKSLELDKIIIIGHSGHAYMALEYAKKYPKHVSHVILIAVGTNQSVASHMAAEQYFQDSVCPERKAWLENDLQQLPQDLANAPDKGFIVFCKRLGAKSWFDYTFDSSPLWDGIEIIQSMFDYVWGTVLAELDITEGLDNFDRPVLLMLGKFDYLVAPFFTWEKIRPQFKNITVRLFEKSSHTPQLEEPENFDQTLLEWLKIR
jgi:proline iminopeptidase